MENVISLGNAIGWPIASIIIAIVVLIIVFRVTATKGEFSFGIKDWLKFGAKAADTVIVARPEEQNRLEVEDSVETTAEIVAEVTEEPKDKQIGLFWTRDNATEVEASFAHFKENNPAYRDDPEFWESIKVDRRRELSVGDEAKELNQLVEQNPTWVWPLIFLIRRHVRLHDSAAAEGALRAALSRENPEKRKWVLREGVTLYYRLFGLDRAMAFIRQQTQQGTSDAETAAMANNLAELAEIEGDPFSSAMLREIDINFDSSKKKSIFDLAYLYGESDGCGVIAFQRYSSVGSDDDWPSAPNNMGVVIKSVSETAQNEYFEKAFALGSCVAAANLARSLVNHGYIRRAELILENVSDATLNTIDIKTLADARAKVATARADMEKEKKTFEEYARKQDRRYTAAVLAAFRFFQESGLAHSSGHFASEDASLTISADAEGASCSYKVGEANFSGRVARKPLCYEGWVSTSGGSILTQSSRRLLVLQVERDLLRVIVWPDTGASMDPLRVVDAKRASVPPLLAIDNPVEDDDR